MKKVLFTSKNLEIGGMEKALLALINSLADTKKYQITLLLEEKKGVLLNNLNSSINVEEYKVSRCRFAFLRKAINFSHRFFWKLKNKNKYDFACCYATYSRICNKLTRIASTNNLLYVHSNYYDYYNHNADLAKKLFDELNISKFTKVAFVSNEAKQGIATVYPELYDNFVVINNIFNYKSIESKMYEKVNYQKDKEKSLFLFVGRLEEESKQITRLIKAVDITKNFSDKFEVLIIGDGMNEEEYEKLIDDKNLNQYIKMLGSRENPYPYYLLADYIILVSNFEGFPVIYNEALFLNKPVLTTINCSDDAINIGTDLGIIMEKDPEDISKKMLDAISNKLQVKLKKVDYKEINNKRLKAICNLIEGDRNE